MYLTGDSSREDSYFEVCIELYAGEVPEVRLFAGTHCLGVARGDVVLRFFDCLRRLVALRVEETH